jgi:hypothetical protein
LVNRDDKIESIEELLLTSGVEFRSMIDVEESWLPLEAFDDSDYDAQLPEDWCKNAGKKGVEAWGLWHDAGMSFWR